MPTWKTKVPTFASANGCHQPSGSERQESHIHQTSSASACRGTRTEMTTSHQRPMCSFESSWLSSCSRNARTPWTVTARAKNRPAIISETPHTQSWLPRKSIEATEGRPSRNAAPPNMRTARARDTPASTSARVPSSTIEMSDVSAAKESAAKKSSIRRRPPGSWPNSCGIHTKVRPSLSWAKIVSRTSSGVSAAPPSSAVASSG